MVIIQLEEELQTPTSSLYMHQRQMQARGCQEDASIRYKKHQSAIFRSQVLLDTVQLELQDQFMFASLSVTFEFGGYCVLGG